MRRRGVLGRHGLRWGILGLTAIATVVSLTDHAAARRHFRSSSDSGESYNPAYASIVVDVNSGAVMQSSNPDSLRHPASLTKIMTLYLLFERLEQGKITLNSDLPVSAHAAMQAPSKLGLKPGETIRVETAIRAIVTKSANDVAVIVAEALGGDEPNFARMMSAKARALGMTQTVYRNASGLPDDDQVTTARDQATLGRAIQDRFPNYYRYFATRTFEYRGSSIRNHNHLLGTVDGLDGIKTGYIHESGFNIVTSVRRANHHIIAVVFGGRTASARDARVLGLIESNINVAAVKRTAPQVVEGWETAQAPKDIARKDVARKDTASKEVARKDIKDAKEDDRTGSAPVRVASVTPAAVAADAPTPGSTEPIKPNAVRTVIVHPGGMQTASLSPLPSDNRQLAPAPAVASAATVTTISTVKSDAAPPQLPPPQLPVQQAPSTPPSPPQPAVSQVTAYAPTAPARPGILGTLPAKVASVSKSVPAPAASAVEPATKHSGWLIQVGAFDDEKEARQRLDLCQSKAKDLLGRAEAFTEKTAKGEKTMFRARFAGLEKERAEAVCKQLKRNEIPCMFLKN